MLEYFDVIVLRNIYFDVIEFRKERKPLKEEKGQHKMPSANLDPTNSSHDGKRFHLCTVSNGPKSRVKHSAALSPQLWSNSMLDDRARLVISRTKKADNFLYSMHWWRSTVPVKVKTCGL